MAPRGRQTGRIHPHQQQADDTEIGQLAGFRHAQAEGRTGAGFGRGLQQLDHGGRVHTQRHRATERQHRRGRRRALGAPLLARAAAAVARVLRRRGYEVSGFTDPHEATAALRAAPQRYDLLVTDYNMPGFCGVDLVREARLIRPDLPVALASGYVTAEIEQAALAEGARALIHKPNDVEELCATVHQLVHGDNAPPR